MCHLCPLNIALKQATAIATGGSAARGAQGGVQQAGGGGVENSHAKPTRPDYPVPGHAKRLRVEDAVHVRQRHQFPERDELNQTCTLSGLLSTSYCGGFAASTTFHAARHVGAPRKLRHYHQILGLVLCFYVGSMEQSSLCMMFGAPPSTISRTLRHAEKALAGALDGYAPLVEAREPLLKHTFGFIDGKNFKVQQPSNADLQNAMGNGWLHTVFVTGTICFAADGCIIWC
ncbi:hypothetical protein ON010_g5448 [Phytophthora cinnamomi]|nr:hypothetical protein ON010_g5448 [Phytophthora cinnamomi]